MIFFDNIDVEYKWQNSLKYFELFMLLKCHKKT